MSLVNSRSLQKINLDLAQTLLILVSDYLLLVNHVDVINQLRNAAEVHLD